MNVDFKHLSVNVMYWQASYYFYTNLLGMETTKQDGRWAMLGTGAEGQAQNDRGFVFELNSGGRFPGYRVWGHYQGVRPSIQVENLEAVAAEARRNRLILGSIDERDWGRRVEFTAPEMIRWTFSEVPGRPASDDLGEPMIGHVEIKVNDMAAQIAFYRDVLGLQVESESAAQVILSQGADHPWLILEPTGSKHDNPPTWAKNPDRAHPVVIGLVTPDIRTVADDARTAGITILKDVGEQRNGSMAVGATGLVLADADGNAVRVWQNR
jgi:catechol 2,3-dioxygenase